MRMSLPGWMTNGLTSSCLTVDSVAVTILVSVIGKQGVVRWDCSRVIARVLWHDVDEQGLDGVLRPFLFRRGDSLGGNGSHIAPEVHIAARHAAVLTEASPPLVIDYDKQPVFDAALCIYAIITKNTEALPNYPTASHTSVSKV